MLKLAVIADDLTGANDAGVQFAKEGLKVQVLLGESAEEQEKELPDVIVLDTDSRAAIPDQAYERVRKAGGLIKRLTSSRPAVFKKIDSTLRGNLGVEIDAVMDELGFEWAAVAPAFPVNGRITVGGWHLLHQVPIAESEIARDPKTPVVESVLSKLLASQSSQSVGHVYLTDVSLGADAILQRITELRKQGARIISFDASTQTHLRAIATAVAAEGAGLWVGCAGLAEMIPSTMHWSGAKNTAESSERGPVLVVAGSVSPVTARQMNRFLSQESVRLVSLQAGALVHDEAAEVRRCAQEASGWLQSGHDVLLASAVDMDAVANARSVGAEQGIDSRRVSEIVAAAMGQVVAQLISLQLAGLFLTGGDTAVSVCRALGVNAIDILAEVLPGIPLGRLVGGRCPGLRVVTKAGAFGDETAIVEAVKVLKRRGE